MSHVRFTFSSLPWDIRRMIYEHVFKGSQIVVEQEEASSPQLHSPAQTLRTYIYRNCSLKNALSALCTNRATYRSLLPVLASHTSLLLPASLHDTASTILRIPLIWRTHIPSIFHDARTRSRTAPVLRQTHVSPALFPSLRSYRVAHLVCLDWREPPLSSSSIPETSIVETFVQQYLESEIFFQAGTLRLFTRNRAYELTTMLWLLSAAAATDNNRSLGWEVEFSLDTWHVLRATRCRFRHRRHWTPRREGEGGGGTDLAAEVLGRDWRDYVTEETAGEDEQAGPTATGV